MKSIDGVIKHLKKEFPGVIFKKGEDGDIVVTVDGAFAISDEYAWQSLEFDISFLFNQDEGIKSYVFTAPWKIAITELRRELAYMTIEVTFYNKH